MNSTRFDRGRTREERTDDTPPRAKISERLDRPASSLLALCLSILYLFSPPLLSSPLRSSFFPFLALDFPLCSSVLFSSRPFSLLKDLSSRSSVRFNFYEHLLPRSLVIACLAVTLRPTLPPGTDRPRFQRTVVASSRRVPSSASFFPCSLFFLSFLPFAHLRLSLTTSLPFPFSDPSSRLSTSSNCSEIFSTRSERRTHG